MTQTVPLSNFSIWFIAKIFVIVALLIYAAFAYMTLKQTKVMINTIKVGFENPLRLVVYLHLAATLVVLFIALMIL